MEYIVIIITSIIAIIALKIGFNIHIKDIKKIKEIGYDKELNKIGDKFPENKEICEKVLEKLENKNVIIEEMQESKTSLYIAISNKIIIANIKDTFTRIQTIAHECLHSIQNRKILLFNFIFSNIYMLCFIIAILLILFNVGNSMLYIQIFTILSIIYCTVRMYLENEAMSRAMYVSKEYMQEFKAETNKVTDKEINTLVKQFDILNKMGIPLTNFYFVAINLGKIILLAILALV